MKQSTDTMGFRIAQARRSLGVRLGRDVLQSDVAEAVGVGAATVSRWEANQAVPREGVLEALAAYLEVTREFLRYGIGEPPLTTFRIPDAMAETFSRDRRASASPPVADAAEPTPELPTPEPVRGRRAANHPKGRR